MRPKLVLPAVLAAAALLLTGCRDEEPSRGLDEASLDDSGKAVIYLWYTIASPEEKTRLEKMGRDELIVAVGNFERMCPLGMEGIVREIGDGPYQLSGDDVLDLAHAVNDQLCTDAASPRPPAADAPGGMDGDDRARIEHPQFSYRLRPDPATVPMPVITQAPALKPVRITKIPRVPYRGR